MIKINNLVKRYGEFTALNHLNLEVKQGEILGLLGPNGSGKSTTMNCMLSLLSYDRGSVKLFGEEMSPEKYSIKQKIGVVPQDIAVFEEMNVKDNIYYYCGMYVKDKQTRHDYVEDVIKLVGLEDFLTFYPKQLSGGLKRRLNIACGIVHKPELIFLDEPTVAVDPQSRNKILESIKELNRRGATIVYTTHYMEEVEILCNHIVIIDHGQVIAEGTKEQLKNMVRTTGKIALEVPDISQRQLQAIRQLPGVTEISYDELYLTVNTVELKQSMLPILNYFEKEDILFSNLQTDEATLNDVFLEITGKELRD
ncbi:ABC transporter ATP-binding protein [Enterococcus sp. 669A]|uniref:ABC transporter ATP-binding protein n=1 Tax=Candidatus Enterococcus moelleringii TaxID=2815325 RepID=A0ABS3LB80_9ENTE|nr:ABC transporter ATP-binding protein [Enterococcus sp. 669A]MBO1306876.1 ABC transporter ATP-binding protein [Enterococcus sp. 669A]